MRYPPYETNPLEDVWENAVFSTAQEINKDLLEMIEEKVREHIEEYLDIPPQWRDEVKEHEYDFVEDVITEVMSKIKIK
jgi:2-polyprenyl-6-methoxyphenol hydroxylase-like FAD-dependent oxidoreductase